VACWDMEYAESRRHRRNGHDIDLRSASFPADRIVQEYTADELCEIVAAAHKRYQLLTGKRLLPPVLPHIFTVSQVAEILGIATGGVRRHCISGNIDAIKVGPRCWLIPEWSIERFVRDHPRAVG
jgi:excisionase family DNA binding protein